VAYVPGSGAARPVVLSQGQASLTKQFARLHGAELETTAGHRLFAAPGRSGALALVEPACIAEGARAALQSVVSTNESASLAGSGHENAQRLFDRPAPPVSLVYVAPPQGADLFSVMQDLDAVLGAEMSKALAQYQKPIQMLGTTQGVRLDLQQEGADLATTLWLLMPNRMTAQIASVSLDAGRDMARVAANTAVKSGSLSKEDRAVLESALSTMETSADGELVRVHLRVPESASGSAIR
jgi:hypothetical protein